MINPLKVLVNGHVGVGKTTLLMAYRSGKFPNGFIPRTLPKNADVAICVDDVLTKIKLMDTTGLPLQDLVVGARYQHTDVVMTLFSCDNRKSFENLEQLWIPEISRICPDVPIILVCTKIELQEYVSDVDYVSLDEAMEIMERNPSVVDVCEISSLRMEGLDETFCRAARAGLIKVLRGYETPFKYFFPFKVGDWIYVDVKGKKHLAVIKQKSEQKIKVYCLDRPNFWNNSVTITDRDRIFPVDPLCVMARLFEKFHPFGLQILQSILVHICEYLPPTRFNQT